MDKENFYSLTLLPRINYFNFFSYCGHVPENSNRKSITLAPTSNSNLSVIFVLEKCERSIFANKASLDSFGIVNRLICSMVRRNIPTCLIGYFANYMLRSSSPSLDNLTNFIHVPKWENFSVPEAVNDDSEI